MVTRKKNYVYSTYLNLNGISSGILLGLVGIYWYSCFAHIAHVYPPHLQDPLLGHFLSLRGLALVSVDLYEKVMDFDGGSSA